jgi:hypothetical protein
MLLEALGNQASFVAINRAISFALEIEDLFTIN